MSTDSPLHPPASAPPPHPKPAESGVPAKWEWHLRVLLRLRARLRRARERPAALLFARSKTEEERQAAEEHEFEQLISVLKAESAPLVEIEAALVRLQYRTYGICEQSQRMIPEIRLRAIPWARVN